MIRTAPKQRWAVFERGLDAEWKNGSEKILGVFTNKHKAEGFAVSMESEFGQVDIIPVIGRQSGRVTFFLRRWVFERDDFHCVKCGTPVTFETGHMHEKEHRGQGGQRHRFNVEVLCGECHVGSRGEHGPAKLRNKL